MLRSADQITASAKPMFDRLGDGLKVVGSGNTAGLVSMFTALNTIKEEHVHSVILLKPTAIVFALGILLFALAYLFLMYSYIYTEHYISVVHPNVERVSTDDAERVVLAESPRKASVSFMNRALGFGLASTYVFFLGFFIACVALIRY